MSAPRKTALLPSSLRRSAIPPSESRTYLQIYQLTAEKKRLERGLAEWKQRIAEAEAQLRKVNVRIEELQATTEPAKLSVRPKRTPMGPGGAMVIEY